MRSIVICRPSSFFLSIKVDRHRICAAYKNSDALLRLGAISARKQRRERRGPARLGDDSQHLPKGFLRSPNLIVCNQRDAAHIFFRDRKHQRAYTTWGERVRRDAPRFGVDRFSSLESLIECGRGLRLDADYLDTAGVPACDAANKPAAADRDKERVEVRDLFLDFQTNCPLAEQRSHLIVRMERERPTLPAPGYTRGKRVRIAFSLYDQVRAITTDLLNLRLRCDAGHKNCSLHPELHSGIGDRHAMIAAGGRYDAGLWEAVGEQVREGAARLERTRMLKGLQLKTHPRRAETEIDAAGLDHRGFAYVWLDALIGRRNSVSTDRVSKHLCHELPPPVGRR